jgi:hypothetical protein
VRALTAAPVSAGLSPGFFEYLSPGEGERGAAGLRGEFGVLEGVLERERGAEVPGQHAAGLLAAYGAPRGLDCSRSTIAAGSRSSRRAKDRVSAVASVRSASQLLRTGLARVPWPAGPSQAVARPSTPNAGASTSLTSCGPLARTTSSPARAGPSLPETGASTSTTPRVGDTGEPGRPFGPNAGHLHPDHPGPAASRPPGPVAACSVAGPSASMVMTIVAPRMVGSHPAAHTAGAQEGDHRSDCLVAAVRRGGCDGLGPGGGHGTSPAVGLPGSGRSSLGRGRVSRRHPAG